MLERLHQQLERHPGLAFGLPVLLIFLVFQGTLSNGFVYDDGKQILENPFVTNPHLWRRIFTGSVWSFMGGATGANFYRPLHIFSYWLLYLLAGPDPAVFHFFQLVIYAATTVVVFEIGRELFANQLAAFVGAVLWALHPLHVEAVAWIAAWPDVGGGALYLLAFLLFLRAEKTEPRSVARHFAPALAFFLALFFKEMALSLPLLILVYWFFFPVSKGWRGRALCAAPYVLAAAAYAGIRVVALGRFSQTVHFWKVSPQVIGAATGLLGQHTKLFFWPAGLSVYRTFELGASLRSPWPWLTLLALLAACGLRRRAPAFAFLLVWWAVTLLPCLDVRQLSFPLLAERFSYLPSVGLCLAMAFAGLVWLPELAPGVRAAGLALPVLALVGGLWLVEDLRALPNWRDNDALLDHSLRVSPDAALVHVAQGLQLQYRKGDLAGAAREFETALRLNRLSLVPVATVTYDSYIGLGDVANLEGRTDVALDYFEKAVGVLPGQSLAYDALGSFYFPRRDYARAAGYFTQAVGANPQDLGARFYLGTCWMKLGKPRQAAEQFHAAREVDPTYTQAFEAEARALEAAGDPAGATRARELGRRP